MQYDRLFSDALMGAPQTFQPAPAGMDLRDFMARGTGGFDPMPTRPGTTFVPSPAASFPAVPARTVQSTSIPQQRVGGLGGLGGTEAPQQAQGGLVGFLNSGAGSDILRALSYALMTSPRNNPLQNFPVFMANFEDRRQKREDANKTVKYLTDRGYSEDDARAIAGNRDLLTSALKKLEGKEGAKYGLNPQTAMDKDGNPVLIQVGDDGTSVQTKLPEGIRLSRQPIKIDAGDHYVLIDPITRQAVGEVPKNSYDPAFQSELGSQEAKRIAEAKAALGPARQAADTVAIQVKDLKDDPYLSRMLGPVDSRLPNISSDAARVQGRINQLQGGAFLQARQLLKGGGAITDYEGRKAEEAFVRMSTAQSEEDFKAALDDFNDMVQQGVAKLEEAASRGQFPSGSSSVPQAAAPGRGNQTRTGIGWSVRP